MLMTGPLASVYSFYWSQAKAPSELKVLCHASIAGAGWTLIQLASLFDPRDWLLLARKYGAS